MKPLQIRRMRYTKYISVRLGIKPNYITAYNDEIIIVGKSPNREISAYLRK